MLALTTISVLLFAATPISALWPLPRHLSTGKAFLKLSSNFDIKITGINSAPKDLLDAIERVEKQLRTDKLEYLDPSRGAGFANGVKAAKSLSSLQVSLSTKGKPKSISEEAALPLEARVEGYSLTVPSDGSAAKLTANSTLGLYRGLTTFAQLWYDLSGTTYATETPIQIDDSPSFPYRGLHLDTARNYFPVSDIKRTLDAMSWVKMSTFHWHVVDSQSFPLVIPGYEELAKKGAYSPSSIYSVRDVRDIVSYANARGIDVIAEIDTPGHTRVISTVYPEHIACPEKRPWQKYAAEPPSGQLRVASAETTKFTADLLTAAAKMFTSTFFSTGGDEVNQNCYTDDEDTQADLAASGKTLEQALDTFTQASHNALAAIGKTPVVWEEIVLNHEITVPNTTLVLVWISDANVKAVAEQGFRIVHAASNYFYLDCGGGGWVGAHPTGNSWCDPFKTWQHTYSFNPVANLTDAEAKLVMGGQHLLWTEQSNPSNLDPVVWPRAASSAELFWSGPGGDARAALQRLHDLSFRLQQRGIKSIALQPLYCALRPNVCDLDY